jgi:2-polyprenyl-6-methoxyphenol hydroxylase-like FAD-dependent oxidoreductase
MSKTYDVIVVGARCAGAPTAMLLARRGYDVLLVDRSTFPSDIMSTHFIHPPGVAALQRWGVLERLRATGCPPMTTYAFDLGGIEITGSPRPADGVHEAFCPRRLVLDELLVRAAVAAGAELREAFTVDEVLVEDGAATGVRGHASGGVAVTERACVVVGADGKNSLVARTVGAVSYNDVPAQEAAYYAYWSGLALDRAEIFLRGEERRAMAAFPTNDELSCVVVNWPRSQFEANRKDYEMHYMNALELAPAFAERMRGAARETRFTATADLPSFLRKPYGPGWALVGDAGYHKDPITALGISDAFRDAEALAAALDDAFAERRSYDEAMAGYQMARDAASLPLYGLTCEFATIDTPPAEMQQLLAAVSRSREASDDFVSAMAGTFPASEFFEAENTKRIIREAGQGAPS